MLAIPCNVIDSRLWCFRFLVLFSLCSIIFSLQLPFRETCIFSRYCNFCMASPSLFFFSKKTRGASHSLKALWLKKKKKRGALAWEQEQKQGGGVENPSLELGRGEALSSKYTKRILVSQLILTCQVYYFVSTGLFDPVKQMSESCVLKTKKQCF